MNGNEILENDLDFFVRHFPFLESVKGKTFLITGATGLIGATFVRCLLKLNGTSGTGIRIIAVARNKEKARRVFGEAPVTWIFDDILRPSDENWPQADYVIHCASPTASWFYVHNPVETLNTIYLGTERILHYAFRNSVNSMVFLSSEESYGTVLPEKIIRESDCGTIEPFSVRSSYPLGKRVSECLCHAYWTEYGVPVKTARLSLVFGAGVSVDEDRMPAQFAKSIASDKDIILHTDGSSAKLYCYSIDAVLAIFFLLFKGTNGDVYNVANSDTYISVRDLAELLVRKFGRGVSVSADLRSDCGYAPMTHLKLDTSKLESLGWKPYFSLEEMFGHLIDWYKSIL